MFWRIFAFVAKGSRCFKKLMITVEHPNSKSLDVLSLVHVALCILYPKYHRHNSCTINSISKQIIFLTLSHQVQQYGMTQFNVCDDRIFGDAFIWELYCVGTDMDIGYCYIYIYLEHRIQSAR